MLCHLPACFRAQSHSIPSHSIEYVGVRFRRLLLPRDGSLVDYLIDREIHRSSNRLRTKERRALHACEDQCELDAPLPMDHHLLCLGLICLSFVIALHVLAGILISFIPSLPFRCTFTSIQSSGVQRTIVSFSEFLPIVFTHVEILVPPALGREGCCSGIVVGYNI
jgi:hypothetical protein